MPRQPVPACEDPDWNDIWGRRQRLHESSRRFDDPSHNWNRRENAERYDKSSRSGYDDRVRTTLEVLPFSTTSRVLDIGAGPGTLAIPLAERVAVVTAVEPGSGMLSVLSDRARQEGLGNITCIPKRWEDVDITRDLSGRYDLVIASLSLTMEDIREALRKMDAVSCGSVCLFWFVDMPFWERMYADLWEPLHGTRYHSGPKADCLFNVLFQMGIYADVRMMPLKKEYRFDSRQEMNTFFFGRFGATSASQEKIVTGYLDPMVRLDGHEVVISGTSTFAMIRWTKAGIP